LAKHAFEELGDAWSPLLRRLSASCSQSQKTIRSCAIEGVQQLQEQFVSTENRIAYARQFYNDEVMKYSTVQATFPPSLCAAQLGFSPSAGFAAADAERTNVQVKL
jgi:LemA protein